MEFKKKTIIWEDNNEPPKSYIWAKPDGKFYEYNATKGWTESKLIKADSDTEGDDGGSSGEVKFLDEMTPQEYAKTYILKDDSEDVVYPDLFLGFIDDSDENAIAVSATTAEEYFEKLEDAYYEFYGYEIEHGQIYEQYRPLVGYSSVPEGQPTVFSQWGEPLLNSFKAIPVQTDTGQAYILRNNFG